MVYNGANHQARERGSTMVKKRRRHAAAYKFRIALEAVEGGKTIGRSSNEYAIRVKKQDSTTRPYQSRLHPDGCNLFFTFHGPCKGTHLIEQGVL